MPTQVLIMISDVLRHWFLFVIIGFFIVVETPVCVGRTELHAVDFRGLQHGITRAGVQSRRAGSPKALGLGPPKR